MPCSTHPKQLPSRRRFQRLSLSLNISKTTIASDSIGCQIMACQCQSVSSSCQLKTSREKKKDFQRSLDNSSKLPVSLSLDARWGMHIQLSHRSPCRSSRSMAHPSIQVPSSSCAYDEIKTALHTSYRTSYNYNDIENRKYKGNTVKLFGIR
jgi:hypothetical protein